MKNTYYHQIQYRSVFKLGGNHPTPPPNRFPPFFLVVFLCCLLHTLVFITTFSFDWIFVVLYPWGVFLAVSICFFLRPPASNVFHFYYSKFSSVQQMITYSQITQCVIFHNEHTKTARQFSMKYMPIVCFSS